MAMSDCLHCWNTPCSCGWDYRNYSIEYLEEQKILITLLFSLKKQIQMQNIGGMELLMVMLLI